MLVRSFSVLVCCSSFLSAQTVTTVVSEGDLIAGVGSVTSIGNLAVNDAGDWRVEVDTNNSDTSVDGVLLLNGVLELREGQILPAGFGLGSFDSINLPEDGIGGWNFFLDGTSSSNNDSGIFHGTNLLIQEGDTTISPDLDPTGTYSGWLETKAIPGTILMMSSMDDPSIIGVGSVDRVLMKAIHDGAGVLLAEQVVVKEGDIPAGQTVIITDLETGPHSFAMNALGQVIYAVDLSGDTAVDHVVYLDGVLLAQEGSPSSLVGRNWSSLSLCELDLNDRGDFVISGTLDGDSASNLLIEKNFAKFRQEGDTLPAIAPFTLTSFGSGPVLLTNTGDVLWYGDWNDPDTTRDTGLFLNDQLIAQEGVTVVGGMPITGLRGVQDGYTMSSNGQYILFECLQGSDEFAGFVNRGGFVDIDSCVPNTPILTHVAGVPAIGESFALSFDNGPMTGSLPFLAVANAPIATFPPCGLMLPQGELMISITPPNPIQIVAAPFWTAGAPSVLSIALPNDPGLVGREFWNQGVFFNPAASPTLGLTNALKLEIGE